MIDRATIAQRIRRLGFDPMPDMDGFLRGYLEAVDLAARIAEDRHTIVECCNVRCSSPINQLHCFECDEIDDEYNADHIRQHAAPEDLARFDTGH